MRKPEVQLDRDTPITEQGQIEAAVTISAYKAAEILHAIYSERGREAARAFENLVR